MDYSDYPAEAEGMNKKRIGIIVGAVVVVIVIVLVVVRVASSPEPINLVDSNENKSAVETCENADNKEDCEINKLKKESESSADVSLCDELEATHKDDCIWSVAKEMKAAGACSKMSNTEWVVRCEDGIHKANAVEKNKESTCDKISDEDKKTACKDEVKGPVTTENCKKRGGSEDECNVLKVADEANLKQDKRVCQTLPEDLQEACTDLVISDDPDKDGLETAAEYLFGSDPDQKDTDGDGYSDGDEVAAGYNPAGPGKLSE